ncbi:MAG: DUF1254 domain-containing protein [Phycisphaerae bacterium]|nr:DUF1254 domain-containing protein [Phycisphaerae bacterium]
MFMTRPLTVLTLASSLLVACANHTSTSSEPHVPATSAAERPSSDELRQLAEDAFIYGLPIVTNYGVMYEFCVDKNSGQYKGPFNTISNEHRVFTYEDTAIVTPNSDTPYSMLWLDLRAEPMVVSVPDVDPARYYSVQLVDGNTYNYGYIGSRATGSKAGKYLIAGPDWKGETPAGISKVFRSGTQFSLLIFRTQLFDAADMPNVEKVQAGYDAQPLSTFLKQPAPPAAPAITFPTITKELAKEKFFEYLDFSLQFAPATPDEMPIRAKLASLGIGTKEAGKGHAAMTFTPDERRAIIAGMQSGEQKVKARAARIGKRINGWQVGSAFGDREFYNGDWLLRAAAAEAGIYGNTAIEAVYPMTRWTANGELLDGSKAKYALTFPAGQLPPVNAFWSVTMYDGKTQLLIKNPINRYLVNSPMLSSLKKNADGSLTLYIQHESPGADKESNWLPAPNGPIYLVMRLYWPKEKAPSILPPGEGTWAPPALTVVK